MTQLYSQPPFMPRTWTSLAEIPRRRGEQEFPCSARGGRRVFCGSFLRIDGVFSQSVELSPPYLDRVSSRTLQKFVQYLRVYCESLFTLRFIQGQLFGRSSGKFARQHFNLWSGHPGYPPFRKKKFITSLSLSLFLSLHLIWRVLPHYQRRNYCI